MSFIMIRIIKWAPFALLFLLFSCSNIEQIEGDFFNNEPGTYGYLSPLVFDDELDTKATIDPSTMKFSFAVNDQINIWSSTGTLLVYSVEELIDNGGALFNGGGFTLTSGEKYYSSYPLIASIRDRYDAISISYEGQVQTGDKVADHVAEYAYSYASATCTNGHTSFRYSNLSSFFMFQITLPAAVTVTELSITAANESFPLNGTIDMTNEGAFTPGNKSSNTLVLDLDDVVVSNDKVLDAYLALFPHGADDYIIQIKDSQKKVYTSPVISKTEVEANHVKRFVTEVFEGETPAVAKIGNVPYPSLAAAVADAQAGDVITMIANDNISLTEAGSEVTINKPVTITGAVDAKTGKPLYTIYGSPSGSLSNSSFNDLYIACGTGTVTVSNVAFEGFGDQISSVMGHSPVFVGSSNNNVVLDNVYISSLNCEGIHINGGTFAINNCNIDCAKTTNSVFTKGICVVNDATGSITGTTITGVACDDATNTSAAIELQGSGDITISGCTIQSSTIGIATTPVEDLTAGTSQVTISNCAVVADDYAVFSDGEKGALTTITSGTYSGLLIAGDNDEGFAISGGIFSDEVDPAFCAEGYMPADNTDQATMEDYPYTVIPDTNEYVAKIGSTKYLTLEAAFAAAEDGDTITLLESSAGNGIVAPQGKFGTEGLIVDFGGFTYTVDGATVGSTGTETQAFQLLKDNKITFTNGTIYSAKAKMLVQNYSDLTLDGMTLTLNNTSYTSAYTLSNNNGNVVIKDSEINANPAGGFAFDVCRYSSYPSVNVTVKGSSAINGDVEVSASGSNAMNGFSLMLESGEISGNLVIDASAAAAMAATPEKAVIKENDTFGQAAPAGFKWVSNGDGTSTLKACEYVATIGNVQYETLEAAFAAAEDGDTITLLADCAGNGIVAPQGKFGTDGLTVDFNGHTYVVNGTLVGSSGTETQAFQLLKDNNITFRGGTISSEKALFLVQNYSNLTLKNMTLTLNNANYAYGYTLSNNNGTVVIDGTTINANPAGLFAFDVCRNSSYPSVDVTVTGNSTINGDVEISASGSDAKDGFSLMLDSGEINGNLVVDASAATAMAATPAKAVIKENDTFGQAAPEGFKWVSNGDGTSTLKARDYVASVGNTKYETLVEAVAATTSGTITLLKDAEGAGIFVAANENKNITIDFNNHSYMVTGPAVGSTGTQSQALHLELGNTVVLKNGTVNCTSDSGVYMLVQNYCNLTLDNMILDGTNLPGSNRYTLSNNNGNVLINNSTIDAKSGNFAFDVCRYANYPSVNVTVQGTSVINGNVEVYASNGDAKDGFSLMLDSGVINGNLVIDPSATSAMTATPAKAVVKENDSFNQPAPSGFKWESDGEGTGTSTLRPFVAIVNGAQYTSLTEAFNAVPAGTETTITMIADAQVEVSGYAITVASGKGVVLDLNGKTVTGVCSITGTSALIRNLGTLTINDSASGGKLIGGADPTWTWDGSDDYSGSYASNVIRNESVLIVNGGTLYNASIGSAAYAIDNYSAGKVTINGGTIDAKKASAIRMFYNNGGVVTVNGGSIGHYNNDDDCSYMGIQVMAGTNADVTVSGGTVYGSYALYSNGTDDSAVSISGGLFDGYVAFGSAGPTNISISGGMFTCWVGTWGSQTGFITGGLFAENLDDASQVAEGYIFTDNTDPATVTYYPYMVVPYTSGQGPSGKPALTNSPKRASSRKAATATKPADFR